MLQIGFIRENSETVISRLKIKNFDAAALVARILETDEKRRQAQTQLDQYLAEANKIAKSIGQLFSQGKKDEANKMRSRSAEIKTQTKALSSDLEKYSSALHELVVQLPNLPHISVPPGKSSDDNEIIYQEGDINEKGDTDLPHWDLAKKHNIIDFELGNKVTGAGFPFYRGKGARLQRALINFFLEEGIKAGYTEYQPPLLVNEDSAYGTGQLPDKEGQMYTVPVDGLYLIPTAEVPITNIYRNVILKENDFPIKNVAYSNCFRREAGSWGSHVRGLNRLHQFDKVEIVQIRKPEESYQALEEMREYVASLLRKLGLPFRIARLCGGDVSFTSALTYDFEVFSEAQKRWLEVSSVSNFEDFQANRMKLRYKTKEGKSILAHTLNGSALALPRIVAALLENNQTDGGIRIPEVLVPYTGFEFI
ncbi:MAG: serine--tRNA ligase [Bacteroidetes bacterium 4572_114]|nr:MAG: serine--tRNA ligase [Bacteroidetes bacterium 4572_114]